MAAHTFLVTVDVAGWPEGTDAYGRTEKDYAHGALYVAGLLPARNLDGFADLDSPEAYLSSVEEY